MRRQFAVNIAILLGANALVKPIFLFGIDRGIQNATGHELYGMYFAAFNFSYIFQILADLGIQQYLSRIVSGSSDSLTKAETLHRYLKLKGFLAILYLLLLCGAAFLCGYQGTMWSWILWIGVNQVLLSWLLALRSIVSGTGKYTQDSILSFLDKFLMICMFGWIIILPSLSSYVSIPIYIGAQTVTLFLACCTAVFIIRKEIKSAWVQRVPILWEEALKPLLPLSLVILCTAAYLRIDGVLLERLLSDGARTAGAYAQSYRIIDALNTLGFLWAGLLLPMYAKLDATNQIELKYLINMALRWIMSLVIPFTFLLVFQGEVILTSLYHQVTKEEALTLAWLAGMWAMMSINYILGSYLTAKGAYRSYGWLSMAAFAFNVLCNWIWIPKYGMIAAACIAFCTQLLVIVMTMRTMHQLRAPTIQNKTWLRIGLYCIILWITCFIVKYQTSSLTWFLASISIVSIGIAWILGLISKQDITHMKVS